MILVSISNDCAQTMRNISLSAVKFRIGPFSSVRLSTNTKTLWKSKYRTRKKRSDFSELHKIRYRAKLLELSCLNCESFDCVQRFSRMISVSSFLDSFEIRESSIGFSTGEHAAGFSFVFKAGWKPGVPWHIDPLLCAGLSLSQGSPRVPEGCW